MPAYYDYAGIYVFDTGLTMYHFFVLLHAPLALSCCKAIYLI